MSENTQQVRRSYKSLFYFLALMFALVAMLVAIWMIGFSLWFNAGSVKPSLDAEYVPTAEYLLDNPYEEPPTTFGELNIELLEIDFSNELICFTIWGSSQADFDRANLLEVFINEQLAARLRPDSLILTSLPAQKPFCINGILESGLHIIEVRAYKDMFFQANYVHRWAIEVE